jgi:teichoic acid transport system ATP-binding protein
MNILPVKSIIPYVFSSRSLVSAKNIGVRYQIGSKREDIQSRIFNTILKIKNNRDFWALKDVSFDCYPGDILGIVGFNGAGKTTLCRVISGLLRPDVGRIRVEGKVSALLSLGTGFNYALSGRDNIFLNGLMLGFSEKYIKDLFHEILDFSGLKDFIDEPLKNYSSGMKSRLAFSIAASIEPEVLILDEALSTGDLEFSEKAGKKLQRIIEQSKIVIIVTHEMSFVEKYCTRGLWIDDGQVKANGLSNDIVRVYKKYAQEKHKKKSSINLCKTVHKSGKNTVVSAKNIGIRFSLFADKGLGTVTSNHNAKIWNKNKRDFWPLRDVSFTVKEGDVVGVIGRNGAGKTTLCRLLTGILKPDNGDIFIAGQTTALLTLGAGFNIQLTGSDNVYLNGMMLGITKKELKTIYSDIVEFSGLHRFMHQPVKNYSSGMRSRLGFSIAAMIKPDVFIIDEVLSAGDISFYEKASAKIQELIETAKAVIVVTHNINFIETVCTRALWLDNGIIKYDGKPEEVVEIYRQSIKY